MSNPLKILENLTQKTKLKKLAKKTTEFKLKTGSNFKTTANFVNLLSFKKEKRKAAVNQ